MDGARVTEWIAGYQRAWRTPGTDTLAELFTDDIWYSPSPWAPPIEGLDALAEFWEAERDGPDEAFTMRAKLVAVQGRVAVARVAVEYHRDPVERWRDLWVMRFGDDGRCRSFEEWPFAPDQPDGH